MPARLLAAADAYHAMTEPRPHRDALAPEQAAKTLGEEASAGRLDADAVAAVIAAAGQRVPRIERPAGLTVREAEVVGMLARGLQTKQVAHELGIAVKTAGSPHLRRRDLAQLANPPHTKTRVKPIRPKAVAVHHPDPQYDTRATNAAGNAPALRLRPCPGGLSYLGRT